MKKVIVYPIIILLSGALSYQYKDDFVLNSKLLFKDPAELALYANTPSQDTLITFENDVYGEICLLVGEQDRFGFRHILARHTKKYFVDYPKKYNASHFPDSITGRDIIRAMDDFYENCIDISCLNNATQKNTVYIGYTEFDDKKIKCLLVIQNQTKHIITFYPFTEKEYYRTQSEDFIYN